jgi:hypothetical protein
LREEERALVEQLDQLAVTEEALHGRIADATRGRDDALRAREAEEREIEGWGWDWSRGGYHSRSWVAQCLRARLA